MVWDAHVGRKLPLIKKIGKKKRAFQAAFRSGFLGKDPSDAGIFPYISLHASVIRQHQQDADFTLENNYTGNKNVPI